MTAAVSLEHVTYQYPGGVAGIFDLTLSIEPGELVVCIGPSGCGKTTLLKLIAGFLRPDRGMVRLQGEEVTHVPVRERGCGIVFQSYALFPHMRVWENVAYPLRVRDIAVDARRAEASRLLDLVGLRDLSERLPAQLSGGQQQRVALARALACSPRVLLLDEPLSALDAATRVAMRDEIRRIQQSQNIAALLITHDQDEALSLADRIAVLREGRLIQFAPPQETYDRPASAFVAGFVGRANLIEARAIAADAVESALGRWITPVHGLRIGESVRLLIRPERIEPLSAPVTGIDNVLPVRILHDRFYGASRQVDVAPVSSDAPTIHLQLETTSRDPIHFVRVPGEAIQFVND